MRAGIAALDHMASRSHKTLPSQDVASHMSHMMNAAPFHARAAWRQRLRIERVSRGHSGRQRLWIKSMHRMSAGRQGLRIEGQGGKARRGQKRKNRQDFQMRFYHRLSP